MGRLTSDVVADLRKRCPNLVQEVDTCSDGKWGVSCLYCDAADQIEQLVRDNDRLVRSTLAYINDSSVTSRVNLIEVIDAVSSTSTIFDRHRL